MCFFYILFGEVEIDSICYITGGSQGELIPSIEEAVNFSRLSYCGFFSRLQLFGQRNCNLLREMGTLIQQLYP